MPFTVTVCTYAMRRFSICFLWLQSISERSTTIVGKLIPILLSIPVFKLSHFFFKIAYLLSQRHLSLVGGKNFLLQFDRYSVSSVGVPNVLESLKRIHNGLETTNASKNLSNRHLTLH